MKESPGGFEMKLIHALLEALGVLFFPAGDRFFSLFDGHGGWGHEYSMMTMLSFACSVSALLTALGVLVLVIFFNLPILLWLVPAMLWLLGWYIYREVGRHFV